MQGQQQQLQQKRRRRQKKKRQLQKRHPHSQPWHNVLDAAWHEAHVPLQSRVQLFQQATCSHLHADETVAFL